MEYERTILELIERVKVLEEKVASLLNEREADPLKREHVSGKAAKVGTVQIKEYIYSLLSMAREQGKSYVEITRENEFFGWDMWCRKYVLLGLEYFCDICPEEELKARIVKAMCAHLDHIIARIGDGNGKKSILETSAWWGSVNSCSILEPVVRLYSLTNEKRYFDFAAYIVSTGGCSKGNLLELALKNEIPPYRRG